MRKGWEFWRACDPAHTEDGDSVCQKIQTKKAHVGNQLRLVFYAPAK